MTTRLARFLLPVVLCLIGAPSLSASNPEQLPHLLADCGSLTACIRVVDRNTTVADRENALHDSSLSSYFQRFGEPAKQEMLRRATGRDPGWRAMASGILSSWPGWTENDIPKLREALNANPGGLVANPLARIGTPAAIEVIIEAVKSEKTEFGTAASALSRLGSTAVPFLMFVPDGPNAVYEVAIALGQMRKEDAEPAIRFWVSVTLDVSQSETRRASALSGLSQVLYFQRDNKATFVGDLVRPLLNDSSLQVRKGALAVMRELDDPILRDPVVLPRLVEACDPAQHAFTDDSDLFCMHEIATFGETARTFGGDIASRHLRAPQSEDRAHAATTLGFIGYTPAIPDLIETLDDKDWIVVHDAIRALGWLGAREAIPALDNLAATHWLSDLRRQAREVSDALKSETRGIPRPQISRRFPTRPRIDDFNIMAQEFIETPACDGWSGEIGALHCRIAAC